MIKVLFICHGNICRSPMAEFIFKDFLCQQGLAEQFQVDSAATSSEEIWNGIGNPVYPPAVRELAMHGISCEGKRAVQMTRADYDRYDYLICMDKGNLRDMQRITGKTGGKQSLLLQFAGRDDSISDPWYSDRFDIAYKDIEEGCRGLLKYLGQKGDIILNKPL